MNVNPIDDYTVAVLSSGVLNTLVKQPYDNTPSEDLQGMTYNEKFKGPYAKVKDVLGQVQIGMTISAVHTALSTYVGLSEQITYPACPERGGEPQVWVLQSTRVEECEAGAHCYLYLSYTNRLVDDEEDADPWQDTWSLAWQSYSVDPYAFCSNTPNQPYPCSPSFETDPSAAKPPASWDSSAMRAHIDQYLNTLPENKTVDGKTYYYYTPDQTLMDSRYFLNDVEAAVMKKKQLGRSATYHYPILTHTTVTSSPYTGTGSPSLSGAVGGDIDHIVNIPSGCPYEFPANTWTWVKIGDDMQETKTRSKQRVTFVRREMFAGFTAVDINFYGNGAFNHTESGILSGRWEIEKL